MERRVRAGQAGLVGKAETDPHPALLGPCQLVHGLPGRPGRPGVHSTRLPDVLDRGDPQGRIKSQFHFYKFKVQSPHGRVNKPTPKSPHTQTCTRPRTPVWPSCRPGSNPECSAGMGRRPPESRLSRIFPFLQKQPSADSLLHSSAVRPDARLPGLFPEAGSTLPTVLRAHPQLPPVSQFHQVRRLTSP